MRVYIHGLFHEYPNADHWELCDNWVELYDKDHKLVVILNFDHVDMIEMM